MRRIFLLLFLTAFFLSGCNALLPGQSEGVSPTPPPGTMATTPATGWFTEAEQTFYKNQDGSLHTGWLELDDTRYYLNEQGVLQTGWLESGGETFYLKADGSITRGKASIDNHIYYFTSSGARILLVNPWNFLPSGYEANLVSAEDGYLVDSACRDDLLQMLSDCRKAGYDARITSAYRSQDTQVELYNNKVWYYIDKGYSEAEARKEAGTIIAVPGTSEHQLGLAVDLVDSSYWVLDEAQENTPAQKWLMEHCWEYGFILRYPNDKTTATGIIYEPWHYRYVGKELSMELKPTGLCLEEYLNLLH